MSRIKTEISSKRAENVKKLIENEKITQKELADRIHMTQQNISRIVQMKQPLTEETARLIVEAFPGYRISWLLGYDDYMTESDYFDHFVSKTEKTYNEKISAVITLAKLRKIDFQLYSSGMFQDNTGRFIDCFVIHKNDKTAYINYNDLSDLVEDLSALVESRLSRAIKKSIKSDQKNNSIKTDL